MSAVGIIPARFRASRFPGKPLAKIAGRPMIAHVIEGARRSKRLREVIVATDDERIAAAAAALGAPVAMTSPAHATGTDRIAEAAAQLSDAIIVNVQGDEPLIEGFVIDAALEALEADAEAPMASVVHRLESVALADPNRVKVVLDASGPRALLLACADPLPPRGRARAASGFSTSGSTPTGSPSSRASSRSRPARRSAPRASSSCVRSSTASRSAAPASRAGGACPSTCRPTSRGWKRSCKRRVAPRVER